MSSLTPESLAARRAALGMSLSQLGEALGVDRQTIWRWEHSTRKIPPLLDAALERVERERATAT